MNLVCALACEAKPMIDLLRLQKINHAPYARFCGDLDGRPVNLLISGVGAENMLSAINWLQEIEVCDNNAWLNIGIAGHQNLDLGQLVLVHCVSDPESTRRHYPPLVVSYDGVSRPLISYNKPCTDYPQSALVDMEGSAFFTAALRSSSPELVQSLKVVSDNQLRDPEQLTAQGISDLIFAHAPAISKFASHLFDLSSTSFSTLPASPGVDHLHLSVSHRHQVERLLHKLRVLNAVDHELLRKLQGTTTANQVLRVLRERLNSVIPALH